MTARGNDGALATPRAAAVLPDVSGLDRVFDYEVPEAMAAALAVGGIVRVELRNRRVRAWVLSFSREAPADSGALKPVAAIVSAGPPAAVVELARWAAWRYAGRLRPFLLAGSPGRIVRPRPGFPPDNGAPIPAGAAAARPPVPAPAAGLPAATVPEAVRAGLAVGAAWLRLPPASRRLEVVEAVLSELGGPDGVLVLVPERHDVDVLSGLLRRRGTPVAPLPDDWEAAACGGRVVVGARAAAFAPLPQLRAAVVLDAHDEAYAETRAPTWSAPVVLSERARRAGATLLLVSACPPLELRHLGVTVAVSRLLERSGWPPVEVLDRRADDPRSGRYSPRLAELIRAARRRQPELPVVCVLNRTGRVRLLACGECGELTRCTGCGSAMHEPAAPARQVGSPGLECPACGASRPRVCGSCGSGRLRRVRIGAAGAAEELAALTGLQVLEVAGSQRDAPELEGAGVLVGTEAVLHRARRASLAVFLDFDQELLAPRLRAAEQALTLAAAGGAPRRRPRWRRPRWRRRRWRRRGRRRRDRERRGWRRRRWKRRPPRSADAPSRARRRALAGAR